MEWFTKELEETFNKVIAETFCKDGIEKLSIGKDYYYPVKLVFENQKHLVLETVNSQKQASLERALKVLHFDELDEKTVYDAHKRLDDIVEWALNTLVIRVEKACAGEIVSIFECHRYC